MPFTDLKNFDCDSRKLSLNVFADMTYMIDMVDAYGDYWMAVRCNDPTTGCT